MDCIQGGKCYCLVGKDQILVAEAEVLLTEKRTNVNCDLV